MTSVQRFNSNAANATATENIEPCNKTTFLRQYKYKIPKEGTTALS